MATHSQLIPHWIGWNPTGDLGPYTMYTSRKRIVVFFDKAPPKTPASYRQKVMRNRWRNAAATWQKKTKAERLPWQKAAKLARLQLTGYNLFLFWSVTHDRAAIATIERQTKVSLAT